MHAQRLHFVCGEANPGRLPESQIGHVLVPRKKATHFVVLVYVAPIKFHDPYPHRDRPIHSLKHHEFCTFDVQAKDINVVKSREPQHVPQWAAGYSESR
eukprot:668701-Prymnesium_polylepis.2